MDDLLHLTSWPMQDIPVGAFPELAYLPQKSTRTGFCFSGGGNRALSAAIGQLASLDALDLLTPADYLSAVSGGSWAASIFTFAATPTDDLLGDLKTDPQAISMTYLSESAPTFLGQCATINLFGQFQRLFKQVPDTDVWLTIVNDVFLKPYGLNKPHWVTLNPKTRNMLLKANPALLKRKNFYVCQSPRPFLIINSTLIWPDNVLQKEKRLPIEFTPLYAGIYAQHHLKADNFILEDANRLFGGGYVATPGFNTSQPVRYQANSHIQEFSVPRPSQPLSLRDMTGSSSAFFAMVVDKLPFARDFSPHFKYWPVQNNGHIHNHPAHTYSIGDGGNLENYGIIPLLIRQVDKLVVFINTATPLAKPHTNALDEWVEIDAYLPPLFGLHSPFWRKIDGAVRAYVFPTEKFQAAKDALVPALLARQQQDQALFCRTHYPVLNNPWLGIQATRPDGSPYVVDILWVYLSMPQSWLRQLPRGLRANIQAGKKGKFSHFPYYPTLGTDFHFFKPETWHDFGGLTLPQVKLLAQLSYWTVIENEKLFKEFAT